MQHWSVPEGSFQRWVSTQQCIKAPSNRVSTTEHLKAQQAARSFDGCFGSQTKEGSSDTSRLWSQEIHATDDCLVRRLCSRHCLQYHRGNSNKPTKVAKQTQGPDCNRSNIYTSSFKNNLPRGPLEGLTAVPQILCTERRLEFTTSWRPGGTSAPYGIKRLGHPC